MRNIYNFIQLKNNNFYEYVRRQFFKLYCLYIIAEKNVDRYLYNKNKKFNKKVLIQQLKYVPMIKIFAESENILYKSFINFNLFISLVLINSEYIKHVITGLIIIDNYRIINV